jgi:hypothetical protein
MSIIKCRLAELGQLATEELLAEQDRLKSRMSARLTGVGPPQLGSQPGRLTQLMHDYLDVQHLLRHMTISGEEKEQEDLSGS